MRRVVYSPQANRLIYLDEKATPEFWDARWQAEGMPAAAGARDQVVTTTAKYLPVGSRILEGGCGRANKVKAMADAGFKVVGVDFAGETVRQSQSNYPGLDLRQGDVRSLDFPDGQFDGYWSIGVIEHFWDGYELILAEAARVLRPQGILFLTAPWFSPFRRRKARAGGYPRADFRDEPRSFYQFALSRGEVCAHLERHGFRVLHWSGVASEISMKEDMGSFRRPVAWLLGSPASIAKRILRRAVAGALNPYCGHSFMAIARSTGVGFRAGSIGAG